MLRAVKRHDTIEDPNEIVLTKTLWKDIWKIRIHKLMEKFKETATSQWAAPILLSILLGYTVWINQSYAATLDRQQKQLQEQHDLLIELRTLKAVEERQREMERQERQRLSEMDAAWRENIRKDFQTLQLIVQGKYPNSTKE